jgi:hypothetical protein
MRTLIGFNNNVPVPEDLQKFLWDHPEGLAPLEKLLLRTFQYGSYEQLKKIYSQYPEQSVGIITRYSDIKRGVKYWIKEWHGEAD